ncbi:MAG: hypothetical protein HN337_02860 [Deltaproteobacteria bacterium]|jgi:protein-S-isoprenylcysteine O-methyltransferase Ste14|nr:hypothetical protein [Deltaproteobacteria bacterium]
MYANSAVPQAGFTAANMMPHATMPIVFAQGTMNSTGTSGSVPGTGTTGTTLPPQMTGPDLQALTQRYVSAFLKTPTPEVPQRKFRRIDPNAARLVSFANGNARLFNEMNYQVGEYPQNMAPALEAAVHFSNTSDAGIAMGFLNPDTECDVGSPKFYDGFTLGQVHYLKMVRPRWEKTLFNASALGMAGGLAMILRNTDLSSLPQIVSALERPVIYASALMGTAGFIVMLKSGLFANDSVPSDKLFTKGPFLFMRNPYYSLVGAGTGLAVSFSVFTNLVSSTPNAPLGALTLTSLGTMLYSFCWRRAIRDEKVLEKQFGDQYLEYKKRTPRYFPAFWKIPGAVREWFRNRRGNKV